MLCFSLSNEVKICFEPLATKHGAYASENQYPAQHISEGCDVFGCVEATGRFRLVDSLVTRQMIGKLFSVEKILEYLLHGYIDSSVSLFAASGHVGNSVSKEKID